jgi:hypothetical protein
LGWPASRVLVIDENLGKSGSSAAGRVGFQRLVTEITMGHVGLVLGIEMSRLARSGADWYQLLELCALAGGRPFYSHGDLQYLEHGTGPLVAELDRLWRAKGTIKGGTAREEHGGDGDSWRALPRGAARLVPRRPHSRPVTELYYTGLQDPPPGHDGRDAGSGR